MKKISLYISEKLCINKDVDPTKAVDLSKVRAPYIYPDHTDIMKMKDYKAKGSKPERLIATIKDNNKLARRFATAVNMGWDDAIIKFGDALVARGVYKQEEVDKYIEVHKK